MKFEKANGSNANGTCYQDIVYTDYESLVGVFGKPNYGPLASDDDDKVTCEWILKFQDGTIATIYDWKTYSGTPMGTYGWHIGGFDKGASIRVREALLLHDNVVAQ